MRGLGRPKENTGMEEDFQQWLKKTEAFSAGVINESETMLEWSAEQVTEITRSILNSCRLRRMRSEEGATWSSCCSRCTQHSWLSRVVRPMTLSPTRRRTRWRHGEDCRNDAIRPQEEENETCCERSFLFEGALPWNFKRGSNDGNLTCSAVRKGCRTN